MFNIAQFRKFDLLLLINVMTHHRAGWETCRLPGGRQIISSMRVGVARAGAAAGWNHRTQEVTWSRVTWSRFARGLIARHAQG
jgi:hypothetical protein